MTPSPKTPSALWPTLAAVDRMRARGEFPDTRNCGFVGARVDFCSSPRRILLSAPLASEEATQDSTTYGLTEKWKAFWFQTTTVDFWVREDSWRGIYRIFVWILPLGFGSGPLLEYLPPISPDAKLRKRLLTLKGSCQRWFLFSYTKIKILRPSITTTNFPAKKLTIFRHEITRAYHRKVTCELARSDLFLERRYRRSQQSLACQQI